MKKLDKETETLKIVDKPSEANLHKFHPEEGITAQELAQILKVSANIELNDKQFAKLNVEAQRHFK